MKSSSNRNNWIHDSSVCDCEQLQDGKMLVQTFVCYSFVLSFWTSYWFTEHCHTFEWLTPKLAEQPTCPMHFPDWYLPAENFFCFLLVNSCEMIYATYFAHYTVIYIYFMMNILNSTEGYILVVKSKCNRLRLLFNLVLRLLWWELTNSCLSRDTCPKNICSHPRLLWSLCL